MGKDPTAIFIYYEIYLQDMYIFASSKRLEKKGKNTITKGVLAAKLGTDEHILLLFYNLSFSTR